MIVNIDTSMSAGFSGVLGSSVWNLVILHSLVHLLLWWQVIEIDSMLVNLRMEAVHVKDLFSINWLCASGLVKNIGRVVEEYRHTRRLLVYTEHLDLCR